MAISILLDKKYNNIIKYLLYNSPHEGRRIQTLIVFFIKEKKMQNVLKLTNMYFDENICEVYSFGRVLSFRLFWIF